VGTTEETLLAPVEEAKEGTSGGGNKRKACSTPPQGGKKKQKKKAKRTSGLEATDLFRRAQADNLLAVIYFRDHPYRALTHGDQEQVKTELMARLCDADSVPTFEGTRSRHGRLDVACSTLEPYEWLHNVVNQITILGYTPEATAFRCIPFGSEAKLVRAEVYLSGPPIPRDRFLRILSGQNRNLRTDRWVLKHQANKPKGQLLVWGRARITAGDAADNVTYFCCSQSHPSQGYYLSPALRDCV